jgi:hypothetical protein
MTKFKLVGRRRGKEDEDESLEDVQDKHKPNQNAPLVGKEVDYFKWRSLWLIIMSFRLETTVKRPKP